MHIQCCVIAKFVEKRQCNTERVNPGTLGFIRNEEMMIATESGKWKVESESGKWKVKVKSESGKWKVKEGSGK